VKLSLEQLEVLRLLSERNEYLSAELACDAGISGSFRDVMEPLARAQLVRSTTTSLNGWWDITDSGREALDQ
jgi:hypothetical protein